MSKGLNLPAAFSDASLYHGFTDHFSNYVTGDLWTLTTPDSGSAVIQDAAGGVLLLTSGDGTAVDNDEAYLGNTKEIFKIAPGHPLQFQALVQMTQAATNAANAYAGVMDAIAANALVDNGAGPKTSFSGAGFFAKDGSLNWSVIYSDGSTQTIAELTAAASYTKTAQVAASAAYQLLGVQILPKTSTLCDVIFTINGSTVYKMMDRTYASATEIAAMVGVKAGTAVNQTLSIDAVSCYQKI